MFGFINFIRLVVLIIVAMNFADCRVAQGVTDPMLRPSLMVRNPELAVLLDICAAGDRLVAVGEDGNILLSDDNGVVWRQVQTPVSATLTAVQFVTPKIGWAVGHFGLVLKSMDGGENWIKQLDGVRVAQLILNSANNDEQCENGDPSYLKRRIREAQMFIDDGPDKPFLDLHFDDPQNGLIVGAFNLIFRTRDGGKTWEPRLKYVENTDSMHLYDIEKIGKDFYIAGEQGLFLHSTDGGLTFQAAKTPYHGSYFGVIGSDERSFLLFGLRGNIFLNSGKTWQKIDSQAVLSINAGMVTREGVVVLVSQDGSLLASRDSGRTFESYNKKNPFPLTGIIEASDQSLILIGARGVMRIETPWQ